MRAIDLFDSITALPTEFVEEAEAHRFQKKTLWVRYAAVAAALALVIGVGGILSGRIASPMAGAGNIAHGSMYDWWGTANIDNFFDIRTWAQKGYVDNVIMIGTRYHQDTWDKPWKDNVRSFADHLKGTKTRLSLHVLVGGDPKHICTLLPQILQEAEIDEIEAYEEWEMIRLGHYGTYRKAVESSGRRIAGVDTPPQQDVKK